MPMPPYVAMTHVASKLSAVAEITRRKQRNSDDGLRVGVCEQRAKAAPPRGSATSRLRERAIEIAMRYSAYPRDAFIRSAQNEKRRHKMSTISLKKE